MVVEGSKESIYKQIDKNFNSMSFCCLRCGSTDLTRTSEPKVREKENDENGIYQEVHRVNNNLIPGSLYIVGIYICNNCKSKFSITALDYGKI